MMQHHMCKCSSVKIKKIVTNGATKILNMKNKNMWMLAEECF